MSGMREKQNFLFVSGFPEFNLIAFGRLIYWCCSTYTARWRILHCLVTVWTGKTIQYRSRNTCSKPAWCTQQQEILVHATSARGRYHSKEAKTRVNILCWFPYARYLDQLHSPVFKPTTCFFSMNTDSGKWLCKEVLIRESSGTEWKVCSCFSPQYSIKYTKWREWVYF